MKKLKNIKFIIGLFYLILLFTFLYLLFSKFSLEEIATYKFIQSNREYLINIKEANKIFISLIFLVSSIVWVFLLGFGSPIALISGFIFGKWLGTFLAICGLSIGSLFLYIFADFFFKEMIKKNLLDKFKNLKFKFKKNEFVFFLIYRLIGGIPFQVANLIPVIFNIKKKNYFFGTFLGMMPQIFILATLGSGFEKIIKNNNKIPSIFELIKSPEIYIPILGFFIFILITLNIKRKVFKN